MTITDTTLATILASLVSALIALVVARRNSDAAEYRLKQELQHSEARLRNEFAMEHTLERAVRTLMEKGFALRSLSLISFHLRGFDDDQLRQLLIRSGCICFKVIRGVEYWGLLEENKHLLKERKALEQHGMEFYDLEDADKEGGDPDGMSA